MSVWHERRAVAMTRDLEYYVTAPEEVDDLRKMAHDDYEERHGYRREDDLVLVNWLRHERTPYEFNLQLAERRQGGVRSELAEELAYEIVRGAAMDAIAEALPDLALACAQARASHYVRGTRIR